MRTLMRTAKSQARSLGHRPPVPAPRMPVADLQRSLGNSSVQRLVSGLLPSSSSREGRAEGEPLTVQDAAHGPGKPLDPAVRASMEARFGADFGAVEVHVGEQAAAAASAAGAKAYAVGRHIVFGEGYYAPHSMAGRALIAHELAHVVQQGRGGPAPAGDGSLEAAAEQAAVAATEGHGSVAVEGASGAGMARQDETEEERKRRQNADAQPAADSSPGGAVDPGNFPFANPTSSIGIIPQDATDFDFTLGLSLISGIPNPVAGRPSLLGGGLNMAQFSFRNQMFTPGLDLGLAIGASYLSQGGPYAKDFAGSYYFSPSFHYGRKFDGSDFGWAVYAQPSLGFRQGAGVPSNYPGLISAQGTGVFGYEPDSGVGFDVNLTGGWSSVNSFSAGPTLSDPYYLGGQGSVLYTFPGQHWSVLGEGFGYYESGSGFVDANKVLGPGATGLRYGFGFGITNNSIGADWATGRPKKTDTIGLNFDFSRENLRIPAIGTTPGSTPSTNTFLITLTLGARKPPEQLP